jgi:predicted metal-dependent hydrolase
MITPDEIIRTKRRSIALIIERDGRLIVRAPKRVSSEIIEKLIAQKEKWIRTKQKSAKETHAAVKPKTYAAGEEFLYLGTTYPLEIVDNHKPSLVLNGTFQLSRSALPKAPQVFERWYRQQALKVFSERVEWYAKQHGYSYAKIRITSAQTRWGSCSSRGTLSFTWRLIMAPIAIIDYLVVHELVHLKVKNHSKTYWAVVRAIMPDYQDRVNWVKKNGHLLSLEQGSRDL